MPRPGQQHGAQAQGGLRLRLHMQAARQKIEANPEARDRAAWTEHCALNQMTEALLPPPAPAPIAEPPAPPPPAPEPQPEPVAEPQAHLHLSRSAGEVAARSAAGEGAAREPALPAPKQDTPASPTRVAMIRLLRQLDAPDVNPLQAILAASRDNPDIAAMAAPYRLNE